MTCHLTGLYPDWWPGRRFSEPIHAWAAGTTNETTRDIVQKELFGDIDRIGTGMLPGGDIVGEPRFRPNTNKAIDYAVVKHISGGTSTDRLEVEQQRRKAYEGRLDTDQVRRKPRRNIYSECLLRTATVERDHFRDLHALEGATEVVRSFLEGAELRVKALIQSFVSDIPHLTEKNGRPARPPSRRTNSMRERREIRRSHGAIYPVMEDPSRSTLRAARHCPRIAGIDFGCDHPTHAAARLGSRGRHDLLTTFYKASKTPIAIHASAIRPRHLEPEPFRRTATGADGKARRRAR